MGKFGPEILNFWFKLKFCISLIRIRRIQYDVHFFSFKLEILYGNVWSKKQNYQFTLKFIRKIRVYIQNSVMVVTFSIFYF